MKMIQIRSIGGEVWQIGGEKWGSHRGFPGMCAQIRQYQAEVLWKEHFDAYFEISQCRGPYVGNIWKTCPFWGELSTSGIMWSVI